MDLHYIDRATLAELTVAGHALEGIQVGSECRPGGLDYVFNGVDRYDYDVSCDDEATRKLTAFAERLRAAARTDHARACRRHSSGVRRWRTVPLLLASG